MKKISLLSVMLLIFSVPSFVFAQLKKDTKVDMAQALTRPSNLQNIVSLIGLNPNKFSMSHSYTLSFSTIGGESISQGLYLNTMQYQLSSPLTMYLQLGFLHQPFGDFGQQDLSHNQFFLSGAGVEYKPSKHLSLQFEFSQRPYSYYSFYNRQYNRRNAWWEKEEERE